MGAFDSGEASVDFGEIWVGFGLRERLIEGDAIDLSLKVCAQPAGIVIDHGRTSSAGVPSRSVGVRVSRCWAGLAAS